MAPARLGRRERRPSRAVWRWVAEAGDAVLALPELPRPTRRLAASLEAAGA